MLKVQGGSQAKLLNRWIAYSESWLTDSKGRHIPEHREYVIQWKNIKSDCFGLLKNPVKLAPSLAYSMAAFWFIFQGDHKAAQLLAFGLPIAVDSNAASTLIDSTTMTWNTHSLAGTGRVLIMGEMHGGSRTPHESTIAGGTFDGNAVVTGNHNQIGLDVWRKTAPATGVSEIICQTANFSSNDWSAFEISFTGADSDQSTAAVNNGDAASGTSLTTSITTTRANSIIVSSLFIEVNEAVAPNDGATEFRDATWGDGPWRHGGSYRSVAAVGATNVAWTWTTSTTNSQGIVEVLEAAAANHWLLMGV